MLYRNKVTGATVDVVSELRGDWEPVKAPTSRKPTKAESKKDDAKEKADAE